MTIRYFLDAQGGFTVGDTLTGATCYAYPTSTHATDAKRRACAVAREMIASGTYRNKLRESGEHDTRGAAAAELLAAFPGLRSCYTSRAWNGWSTGGRMEFHDRPRDQAGRHNIRLG